MIHGIIIDSVILMKSDDRISFVFKRFGCFVMGGFPNNKRKRIGLKYKVKLKGEIIGTMDYGPWTMTMDHGP